jgi:hypothetical protein
MEEEIVPLVEIDSAVFDYRNEADYYTYTHTCIGVGIPL